MFLDCSSCVTVGSSYWLAMNRFVISTFSRYASQYVISAIASFLSHVGGSIIVDGFIHTAP